MAPPVLDPQIQAVLDEQAAEGAPPLEKQSPEEARALYAKRCKEQWGELEERPGSAAEVLDAVVAELTAE